MTRHAVTVVVPVFNVADYLEACLDSVSSQVGIEASVVLVDDGSTDGSGEICAAYASGRPRWRTISVDNGGPGRARNIGLRASSTEFVAFLDSDDVVPPDTYARMTDIMAGARTEVATGRVVEFAGASSWPSGLHRRALPRPAESTTLAHYPTLVFDSTAGNKMYRRDFLERHHLRFPEGVWFEDLILTAAAYTRASGVSVLDDPVLWWRVREGGQASTTQRRAEMANVRARLAALEQVDAILAEAGHEIPRRTHDVKAVEHDLRLALQTAPDVAASDRGAYLDELRRFLRRVPDSVWMGQPVRLRLAYWLLAHGRDDALLSLLAEPDATLRPRRRGRRRVAEPLAGDARFCDVPPELFDITSDHPVAAQAERVWWTRSGARMSLRASVEGMTSTTPVTTMRRVVLRRSRRDAWLPSRPSRRRVGATGRTAWDGVEAYAPAAVLAAGSPGEGRLVLQVAAPGLVRSAYVDTAWNAYAMQAPPVVMSPRLRAGRLVWPHYAEDGLRFAVHQAPVLIGAHLDEREMRLDLEIEDHIPLRLELRRPGASKNSRLGLDGAASRWRAVVLPEHWPPEPRTWCGQYWHVWVVYADESATQVVGGPGVVRPIRWSDGWLLALDVDEHGCVRLARYPSSLVVDDLALQHQEGRLVLRLHGRGPDDWGDAVLRVSSGMKAVTTTRVSWQRARWSASVEVDLPVGQVLEVSGARAPEAAGAPVRCGAAAISTLLEQSPLLNGVPAASVTQDRRLLVGDLTTTLGRPSNSGDGT